ncbi:nuclear transport factor 2 family protein [Pseudoalteromonas piscicida]|uniref:nuclear transport factor 2 family protein n=1 Tax=Pseudoalteromonas piscicida TaxID=43662 RepID=UPI001C98234E|nr:nuclear transport factor 2 family protein [Pseudoalteromonas piscicida]QZO14842.1 nuclear transport factor 2 family protein [Pseudoalteromonas piscicida]
MKSYFLLIAAAGVMSGCMTTNPSSEQRLCETTLHNYIKYRDSDSAQAYQSVFTQDATFSIPALNINITGAEEITIRQQQAIKTTKSMHMITSADIQPIEANKFIAKSYFVLYQQPKSQSDAPITVFNGVYEDELKVINGRCLINHRLVNVIKKETWH